MAFAVEERTTDWVDTAPIRVIRSLDVHATPAAVFSVLADHVAWPLWYAGMRRVRVLGSDTGAGVRRTVWFGGTRLDEHVVVFEEPCRIAFAVVSSNLPGLNALTADWRLAPVGRERTRLTLTIGAEISGLLRYAPWIARVPLERWTKGASGLTSIFR